MLQYDSLLLESLSIIINSEKKIYFCNQSKEECINIIDELKIMDKIKSRNIGAVIYNNCFINIEEFNTNNEVIYHIVIEKHISKDDYLPNSVYVDYYTGLYNRSLWENISMGITKIISSQEYAVIVININNFKEINGKIKEKECNDLIKAVSNSIKNIISKKDIPIRYREDKFLIILPESNENIAQEIIMQIKRNIEKNNFIDEVKLEIRVGISLGNNIENLKGVLEEAENNMYMGKNK